MKLSRPEQARPAARTGEAVILFAVNGIRFAVAARAVEEIRSADSLRPLRQPPHAPPQVAKVRYLLDRGGKLYWVVDAGFYFRMLPVRLTRVLVMRRGGVALLVERIDLMSEIPAIYALPRAFMGEERQWYRGLALMPGAREETNVVPVINPDALLTAAEAQILGTMLRAKGAKV